jgi:polar amino acid transport system substrate-binding protein
MIPRRAAFVVAASLMFAAACAGPAASPTPAPTGAPTPAASATAAPAATVCDNLPAGSEGDLLATLCERGKIVISTDADYAPQSSVTPTGAYEGFDIDVGEEIARRLGVEAEWSAQIWDTVIAGSWSGRWDMSVGSITVTPDREQLFSFTRGYYYAPAMVAVLEGSGFTSIDDLAGEKACVGEDTTYLYWIDGTLDLGNPGIIVRNAPEGMTAHTLETDANCAEAMRAGQTEVGKVFVTAEAVIDEAIAADTPIEKLGEPVFFESLSVAFDKNGPEHGALLTVVDEIIGEMHADGTLTALSMKWYGKDLTKAD